MKKLSFPILISTIVSVVGSVSLACGGVSDITNDKIIALPFVKAVQDEIANVYGETVEIESIVPSGNNFLNMDKRTVARARCNANYIHVYMKSQVSNDLVCMTVFQIHQSGSLDFAGLKAGVACRRAGEDQVQFTPVPNK